jgi:peptidyl-prolyl cis-trans isomerase D
VFTVVDIKPAHAPSFDEYKPHILTDYRQDQAPQLLKQKSQELADKAKDGNLQQAAKDVGATYLTSDLVGRDATVPQIGPIASNASRIFALTQGQVGGPFTTDRSAYMVKLEDKQEPTAADLASHFDATRDKMLQDKREKVFSVYVSNLMDKYKAEKRIMLTKQASAPPQLGQGS